MLLWKFSFDSFNSPSLIGVFSVVVFDRTFSSPPVSFHDEQDTDNSDDFHIYVMFFIDDYDKKEAEERSEGMNLYVSHYLCYLAIFVLFSVVQCCSKEQQNENLEFILFLLLEVVSIKLWTTTPRGTQIKEKTKLLVLS